MRTSGVQWKRIVEKVSFEPGMKQWWCDGWCETLCITKHDVCVHQTGRLWSVQSLMWSVTIRLSTLLARTWRGVASTGKWIFAGTAFHRGS